MTHLEEVDPESPGVGLESNTRDNIQLPHSDQPKEIVNTSHIVRKIQKQTQTDRGKHAHNYSNPSISSDMN